MKLAKKTFRSFLIAIACLFPIACLLIYLVLRFVLSLEVDEQLQHNQLRYKQQLIAGQTIASIAPIFEIKQLETNSHSKDVFNDVEIYESFEKEYDPYRELVSVVEVNGEWFELTSRQSVVEFEDLLYSIMFALVLILSLMMIALFMINRYLFEKIWAPFSGTLEKLNTFEAAHSEQIHFEESNISEFSELNHVLLQLTSKVQSDYAALKEFTENASHEIQTPLAIIAMHLDELSQEQTLSPEGHKNLIACTASAQRLSKLNEKLLLLAKIDNAQFRSRQRVNLNEIVDRLIAIHAQLEPDRAKLIHTNTTGQLTIEIDPALAQILLSNLLSNALRHGRKGEMITLNISETRFSISNASTQKLDTTTIFNRFQKQSNRTDSIGLGLAIAMKISDKYSLNLKVESDDERILFSIEKND